MNLLLLLAVINRSLIHFELIICGLHCLTCTGPVAHLLIIVRKSELSLK